MVKQFKMFYIILSAVIILYLPTATYAMTEQPLFTGLGDTPWISENPYHNGQAGHYTFIDLKFEKSVSKIKLHYFLRNGWYSPTGFKITDIATGKELARRENSISMFDMTEEIVFSEPSSAFRLSVSNPAGDYVVFYSADSVAYSDDVILFDTTQSNYILPPSLEYPANEQDPVDSTMSLKWYVGHMDDASSTRSTTEFRQLSFTIYIGTDYEKVLKKEVGDDVKSIPVIGVSHNTMQLSLSNIPDIDYDSETYFWLVEAKYSYYNEMTSDVYEFTTGQTRKIYVRDVLDSNNKYVREPLDYILTPFFDRSVKDDAGFLVPEHQAGQSLFYGSIGLEKIIRYLNPLFLI